MSGDRPQVGEEPQLLANLEQPRLGPRFGPRIVPLRPADGTQQDGLRRTALGKGPLRQRIAKLIDRAAADRTRDELKGVPKPLGHPPQHALSLRDNLRTNPVAGEQHNLGVHEPFLGNKETRVLSLCCRAAGIHRCRDENRQAYTRRSPGVESTDKNWSLPRHFAGLIAGNGPSERSHRMKLRIGITLLVLAFALTAQAGTFVRLTGRVV